MPRVNKTRSRVRQQDQRPPITQKSVEINTELFGRVINVSVEEPLPRTQLFLRWRPTGTYNAPTERKRTSSTNTPQSNLQTVPANNTLSISNARKSFSADQRAQITQTVSQSISSFSESQHATTTATRVDEQTTIPPSPT
jgi:hypothetical protein